MPPKPQEIAPFQPAEQSLVNIIARAASDPSIDISKLEALLAMQERVIAAQNKQHFNAAMADAQEEMIPVVRTAKNEYTHSRYAVLEAIDGAIRPIYSRYGFSVRYRGLVTEAGSGGVVCVVSHKAGHEEEFPLQAPLDLTGSKGTQNKPAVQALGSTITYLRRYALMMAFNVVLTNDADDDDGEGTRRTHSNAPLKPTGPDPKAVAWKDKTIELMAAAQSEAGLAALWKQIKTNYEACAAAWPDMAAEIDAADKAARARIGEMGTQKAAAEATDGGWPSTEEQDTVLAG